MTDAAPRQTTADAMAIFEQLLGKTTVRFAKAQPIEFRVGDDVFHFDPTAKDAVFRLGKASAPALTLTTTADVLVRLLTNEDFWLGENETFGFAGDPEALSPVIQALKNSRSPLSIRFNR